MVFFALVIVTQFELNPTELYNLGNEYFEQGKYSEAIAAYEQASKRLLSARVFYNLGNAYFKKGMHGMAILNYRKALFLSPRDGDVRHNLEFARNYRVDKIASSSRPLARVLSNIFQYVSLFEAQIMTTILFVTASFLLSLYIIYRRKSFGYAAIVIALFCLFFFINWQVWAAERNGGYAVVTAPEVKGMSGPGDDYKEIVVMHDGAEVRVRERRGDYLLIQLPGGIGGWVPMHTIEEIF